MLNNNNNSNNNTIIPNIAIAHEDQSNIIILQPGGFELSEAIVSANIKKLSAQQIVKIAVNSIPQNYPESEFGLVGYYRDYQVKNSAYTNLNEAIIRIVDEGFGKKNSFYNQYELLSYSKNLDFEIDDFAKQPYDYKGYNKIVPNAKMKNDGGNELIMLSMHDALRNYKEESFSFINDINSDFVKKHKFALLRKTNYNKETVYEIEIRFKNDHYRARGKIFVNTKDFSIHKLDYAVHKLNNAADKNKKSFDYSTVDNLSERFSDGFQKSNTEVLYHIQTEYVRGENKKMFLNYISFYNKILIQRPPKFESEFVINLNDNSFRIRLNKLPVNLNKIKSKHFKIKYKNVVVPINEFYFLEDERTFVVCPDLDFQNSEDIFEHFNYSVSDVSYKYVNIKDSEGNKLDDRKWEYIHQYREFFTQETKTKNVEMIDESNLMIRLLPLDSPKQPISGEGMKNEYWKNTPLPSLKN